MALTKCPECKETVSEEARFCPHCGYYGNEEQKYIFSREFDRAVGNAKASGAKFILLVGAVSGMIGIGMDPRGGFRWFVFLTSALAWFLISLARWVRWGRSE